MNASWKAAWTAVTASLLGCSSAMPPPRVVADVDLGRYAGTWHEIARLPNRFERDCVDVTATYTIRSDGDVEVLNRCVNGSSREAKSIRGKAWRTGKDDEGKLAVRFFWPFTGDYWILDVGPDYEYAVVGSPDRDYAWILSRTKPMDDAKRRHALDVLEREGFATAKLEWVP